MKRMLIVAVAAGAVAALLAAGTALAAEPKPVQVKPPRPATVAIAIGQLKELDGTTSTVDLLAAERGDRTAGSLRFYSPREGYYAGKVRQLSVENDTIKASGVGPLLRPDGTRVRVQFSIEVSADTKQVKIAATGPEALEYTMSGRLDPGFVKAGNPKPEPQLRPTAR